MRKLKIVCMLVMLSAISLIAQGQPKKWVLPSAFPAASNTSAPVSSAKRQSVFATREEARAAYRSGNFSYYVPTHLGMTEKRPVDGVHTKAYSLERDTLAELFVFGNKFAWVVLQEGTVCRFDLDSNGQPLPTPYAHHSCGNPIKSVDYPEAKVVTQVAPSPVRAPEPITVQAPAPQVFVQVPAPQITLVPAPPTYITAPAPQVTVQQQAPAMQFGPARPSVLPQERFYDRKPNYEVPPQPFVPEKKWSVGKKWCVGIGVIGGAVGIYTLLHKDKKAEPKRAVVTD